MNIWESVHRGLDKASREAARIARIQKLRSTIDGLNRQITTQQSTLITRAMELFTTGRMTQSELISICQDLATFQHQFNQAQNELKQIQQGPLGTQAEEIPSPPIPAGTQASSANLSPSTGEITSSVSTPSTPPLPPDYHSYERTIPMPPPPPGVEPMTIGSAETIVQAAPPVGEKQYCPGCRSEILGGIVYCPNCGSFVQNSEAAHQPTVRGGIVEGVYQAGEGTVRADAPLEHAETGGGSAATPMTPTEDQETVRDEVPAWALGESAKATAVEDQETVRAKTSEKPETKGNP